MSKTALVILVVVVVALAAFIAYTQTQILL